MIVFHLTAKYYSTIGSRMLESFTGLIRHSYGASPVWGRITGEGQVRENVVGPRGRSYPQDLPSTASTLQTAASSSQQELRVTQVKRRITRGLSPGFNLCRSSLTRAVFYFFALFSKLSLPDSTFRFAIFGWLRNAGKCCFSISLRSIGNQSSAAVIQCRDFKMRANS